MDSQSGNLFSDIASKRNSVREARTTGKRKGGLRARVSGILQEKIHSRDRLRSDVQTMQAGLAAKPALNKKHFDLDHMRSANGKYESLLTQERIASAEVDACIEECSLVDSTDGYEMAR